MEKNIEEILSIIRKSKPELLNNFGVENIAVFGSFVKTEQKKNSDIDIMVSLKPGYKTFDNFMELRFYLEEKLQSNIDLTIKESIRKEFRESIYQEAIYV
jgi:predicted nucleotidyltransferase